MSTDSADVRNRMWCQDMEKERIKVKQSDYLRCTVKNEDIRKGDHKVNVY
jgi:hypothetical protein